jgi:23S rRNA (cytosine1962-C5)-methyltransferase
MFLADKLKEYTVLDTGGGEKLEDIGGIILQRPDPQVIWERQKPDIWKPHAVYDRSSSGGGSWRFIKKVPDRWTINCGGLRPFSRAIDQLGLYNEKR